MGYQNKKYSPLVLSRCWWCWSCCCYFCCCFRCTYLRPHIYEEVDLRALGFLGTQRGFLGLFQEVFQGFSKVLQKDPPRCPQGLPGRHSLLRRPPKACPRPPEASPSPSKACPRSNVQFRKNRANTNFMLAQVGPKSDPSWPMLAPSGLKVGP